MIIALARPPLARLLRRPRTWMIAVGWSVLAVSVALAARSSGSSQTTDGVLLGAYAPFVLPLLTYALAGAVVGSHALRTCVAPLVSFGAAPARAAAVTVLVAVVGSSAASALLADAMVLLSHGPADAPLAPDVVTTAYVGALGGGAYAAWFMLGASMGRRGGGRALLLIVDWIFGASDGASALATPRGHVRNLLGGTPPMGLPERTSATALAALALACGLVAVVRAGGPGARAKS